MTLTTRKDLTMPKVFDRKEYEEATASTNDFERMPAGGYVCAIQAVRTGGTDNYGKAIDYIKEKQYVKLIFDVVEGDFAGKFSDKYWAGEDMDWGHTFYLSWKNINAFKSVIQALDESNPGFDAYAAFEADQWTLFIGKKIGLVFGEEQYIGNDGNVKTKLGLPSARSIQVIHDGKFRIPKLKTVDGGTATADAGMSTAATPAESVYDDDLPF